MADDEDKQNRRLKLKFNLEELRKMKGSGTELVTVYLPPDRQISDVRQLLQNDDSETKSVFIFNLSDEFPLRLYRSWT